MDEETQRTLLRSNQAAERIRKRGIPMTEKTLRNRRCAGTGPRCVYFGSVPLYDPADLDAWIKAMLSDQPANKRAA